ncbi:hypothetical protein GHV40_01215 [Devosia sp. D6-9]|nr:hypothetical protein GHV40_01215 [Devosia sp. D6-9]
MAEGRVERSIDVDRVFLDLSNPRHEPFTTQDLAIDYLCKQENVLQLARDIKKHGLNPLERFAVTRQDGGTKDTKDTVYVAAEGNRRLCALMLLNDPELAPASVRPTFEKLATGWMPVEKIPAVIFEDQDDLDLWLERTHQGQQGGVGRKHWDAAQKQRHSGDSKNKVALALLDYAVEKGMISADEQKGKITTIQRYVGNPIVRAAMGIDVSNPDELSRTSTPEDFELLAGKFFKDLLAPEPKVTSRSNKKDIEAYAHELVSLEGQSRERIEPTPLLEDETPAKKPRKAAPKKNVKPKKLPYSAELASALKALSSWKLEHLYNSLCTVSLQENTPLLAVGLWSLVECLTAHAGRNETTDFNSFLNATRLQAYGLGDKGKTKSAREAIARIQAFGNSTKHDGTAAAFNSDQLANDLETTTALLIKVAEDAKAQKA